MQDDWFHRYWPIIASLVTTLLVLMGWRRADEKDRKDAKDKSDHRMSELETKVVLLEKDGTNRVQGDRDIWEAIKEIRTDNKAQTEKLGKMDGKLDLLISLKERRATPRD